jgi:hypothetical protein
MGAEVTQGKKTAADAARPFNVHPATIGRLLARNIANDFITAIPFCNSKYWGLSVFVDRCTNVRFRNS